MKESNGKIKGIRLYGNVIHIFLTNNDEIEIGRNSSFEEFSSEINRIDKDISDDFKLKLYRFVNGGKK